LSAADHEELQRIFFQACRLDESELTTFLDRACQGEPELRAEVEALLQADSVEVQLLDAAQDVSGAQLLAESMARTGELAAPEAELPEQIGRYRILRFLGEGGMSTVYEAVQEEPKRRVALKVVRPSMVTAPLLKRFRLETQIQANLNHPGIAQIYETGGVAEGEGGQPYFAMELIEGEELHRYADIHDLGKNQRLELIALLCDIVHYAHQQGVVHRDLKPSNILVTGDPQATEEHGRTSSPAPQLKVLDFGVARALDSDLHNVTIETNMGQLIGTIPYMSPEQAAGDPKEIDIRSDVYSIGVLAYELLAGKLPYELRDKLPHEAVRVICENDPTRFTQVNRFLRGDVETILRKALSKEKGRRYQSAAELAADIRRFLAHDPIDAQPASTIYQLRKFAQRNKAVVGGAFATLVVAIVGTIVATSYALSANRKADDLIRASYAVGITAASNALDQEDFSTAALYLDKTPVELRGWEYHYLRAKTSHHLREWELPSQAVTPPVLDSTGHHLFAVLAGGRIAKWQVESGMLLDIRPTADQSVLDLFLVCHPRLNGNSLRYATQALGGGIVVDDLIERGREPIILESGNLLTAALAWDLSGQKLLYQAGETRVWDGSNSRTIHQENFARGAFSQAGDRIALASGSLVVLVDLATGNELRRITLDDSVTDMKFSPDDHTLAIAGHNRNVFLLDGHDLSLDARLSGHQALVFSLAWANDSNKLITTSRDGTMRAWDRSSPGSSSVIASELLGDTIVAILPDGRNAIALGEKLQEFALTDPTVLLGHESFAYRVSFSADGSKLASAGFRSPQVLVWDAKRFELLRSFSAPEPVGGGLFDPAPAVAFSQDGTRLVSGWDSGTWQWDIDSGERPARPIPRSGAESFWTVLEERSPAPRFEGFEASPSGFLSTSFGGSGVVIVTDRTTSMEVGRLEGHLGEVYCATFSPDGTRIATGGNDATIRIWNARTFELLLILRGHDQYVMDLEFSPDGSLLASASGDRTIRLWDTKTLKERRALATTR
jgi:eukaryotic-like serine/threonine-protein kinase